MLAADREIYQRGLRLEAYFTQPFLITEAFTKKQGNSVPLRTVVADVQRILKGELDHIDTELLKYVGNLDGV
jgi:F-type H+/Na+-transporting ATPase subunit beta